jgi:orotate phosphoribosyltransferase
MDETRERLKTLCRGCIKFGDFTLASGKKSDFYFDGRLVTLDPEGADLTGRIMYEEGKKLGASAVSGISAGADPLISTVGHIAYLENNRLKMSYVRKQAKEHGTKKEIEGPPLSPGDNVIIVEDVVTTGGSCLRAAEVVRNTYGSKIAAIIVLLDREEGGREAVEAAGYKLISIFRRSDFK